jgi:hypothetical protein
MAFAQPAPERTPAGARLSVDVASGSARWSTRLGTALTGSRLGQRKPTSPVGLANAWASRRHVDQARAAMPRELGPLVGVRFFTRSPLLPRTAADLREVRKIGVSLRAPIRAWSGLR